MDRVAKLDAFRLAAAMEIFSLNEAGELIERLPSQISAIEELIKLAIKSSTLGDAGEFSLVGQERNNEIDRLIDKLQSDIRSINKPFNGSIMNRLDRSQYYLEQYHSTLDEFRSDRIEGYQKYSEFVSRRMGGIFGYSNLLRNRLKDILSDVSSLNRRYASFKITDVTTGIGNLTKTIKKRDEDINEIQDFGEIALIGVLMPYYIGSALSHVFNEQLKGKEETFWICAITISISLLIIKRRKKDSFRITRKGIGNPSFIALVSLVIIWGAFLFAQTRQGDAERVRQKSVPEIASPGH